MVVVMVEVVVGVVVVVGLCAAETKISAWRSSQGARGSYECSKFLMVGPFGGSSDPSSILFPFLGHALNTPQAP